MPRRKNILNGYETQKLPQLDCPNFDDAIELFIEDQKLKNITPRTIQWHKENFRALERAFEEQNIPWDLKSLTQDHLKHNFILYSIEKNNNKATTINNRMKSFKSFWQFLCDEGYLTTNITTGIKKLLETKIEIITLDESEIKAMFYACDTKTFTGIRDLAIMKTLLNTGMQLKEIVLLKLEDVLFKENLILVDRKGLKERYVPLSPELKKAIKDYLIVRGETITDALFITIDNKSIRPRSVQDRLELYTRKAGITKQSSPQIWRHTFARLYLLNTGDPFTLKKILGYSDWAMVNQYVDAFAPEMQKQLRKSLNRVI